MDFTEGLAAMLRIAIDMLMSRDDPHGLVPDNFGSFLSLGANENLIGTVNLVIGQYTVLQNEPPRPPSFPVIDPLVEYSRYPIPNDVVYFDIYGRLPARRRRGRQSGSRRQSSLTQTIGIVVV